MTIDIFSLRKLVEFPSKNVPGNLRNRGVEFRQDGCLEPSSEDGKGEYGVGQLRLEKEQSREWRAEVLKLIMINNLWAEVWRELRKANQRDDRREEEKSLAVEDATENRGSCEGTTC